MSDIKTPSMDDLLDMNLDDLADMPEFLVPPAGAYAATIKSITKKEINKHPSFEVTFILNDVVELADATEKPPEKNAETSTAFMMDNEIGQGSFKEFLKPLAAHLGTGKVSEIIEQAKGLQILLLTEVRKGKDKNDGSERPKYLGIKGVTVS